MRAGWAFVFFVCALDVWFAVAHEGFNHWELNPVAARLGLNLAVAVRVGTVAAAFALYWFCPDRVKKIFLSVLFAVHLLVFAYLLLVMSC